MRAHLQRAGPNLTSSPVPFQIRVVSPSTALQQDLSPDLAACGCRKKKQKHFWTNFPPTRPNAQCCTSLFDPRQQVPLANGTTNACSSSKCEVKLELAFEYLMSKDRLQWVTITSQQVRGPRRSSEMGAKVQIPLTSAVISGHHDEHLPAVNGGRADGEEIRRQH